MFVPGMSLRDNYFATPTHSEAPSDILQRILVSEADPVAPRVPHVDVAAAAEGAGRERRHDVAGVKRIGGAGVAGIDDHALPVAGAVAPVRRRELRAEDERNLRLGRVPRRHAAAGAVPRLVQDADL